MQVVLRWALSRRSEEYLRSSRLGSLVVLGILSFPRTPSTMLLDPEGSCSNKQRLARRMFPQQTRSLQGRSSENSFLKRVGWILRLYTKAGALPIKFCSWRSWKQGTSFLTNPKLSSPVLVAVTQDIIMRCAQLPSQIAVTCFQICCHSNAVMIKSFWWKLNFCGFHTGTCGFTNFTLHGYWLF